MGWKELVELKNLCDGSPLAAIVFCCRKRECPYRDEALRILGVDFGKFIEIKEKYRLDAKETCYGNLAYCCSFNSEKECKGRDAALKRLGMTHEDYLRYKYKILKELIPKDKMELAFKKKVSFLFAFEMVRIDDGMDIGYRGLMLGNPELTDYMLVLDYQPMKPNVPIEIRETMKKEKFLNVRVSGETYNGLVKIATAKGKNLSDIVREAINLYLSLNVATPKPLSGKIFKDEYL